MIRSKEMTRNQLQLTSFIKENEKENKKSNHKIFHGDVRACLAKIDDNIIDYIITSPPYWSQRDYGFKEQIGNEKTLEDYIANLIDIFRILRLKLNDKGVFYLNIGDKYINRYGNNPLGMIPFKVAYYMVKDGWILNDIKIWYKTNHMPSSVKNRFTNTYEPVFVFSKLKNNYYSENTQIESSILKIPLQPTSFAHIATYPEKLVESLLKLGTLKDNLLIFDPFGGSGTTCKAVQNINNEMNLTLNSIMIEANNDYVEIIKNRCNISTHDIFEINSISFTYPSLKKEQKHSYTNIIDANIEFNYKTESMAILINKSDIIYEKSIGLLFSDEFIDELDDDGVLFFSLPNYDIEKIFTVSNADKWIIRNMIIIPKENRWIPIFMLVKDTKMVKYKFNIDSIRVNHKTENKENWNDRNFIGYKVFQSNNYFKNERNGFITNIISKKDNGFPNWVMVQWDNGDITKEEAINNPNPDRFVNFFCPKCNALLKNYYHNIKIISCPECNLILWKNVESIPKLELNDRNEPEFKNQEMKNIIFEQKMKKSYNGKFKNMDKKNIGQSPGARSSISEQYFSMQRYYKIKHGLFSDYLNLHRVKKKLSKIDLINLFPSNYKHTVGHWLRKDMSGSLPKYEDMIELNKILELDDNYMFYLNRMGLKFQFVITNIKGKNPGDFLDMSKIEFIEMIKKTDN